MTHRAGPCHQTREVDRQLVQAGGVRAVGAAEPALEALVHDAVLLRRREPAGITDPDTAAEAVEHLEQ